MLYMLIETSIHVLQNYLLSESVQCLDHSWTASFSCDLGKKKTDKFELNYLTCFSFITWALGPPISVRTQPGCMAITSTPVSARSTDRLWIQVKSQDDVNYVLWFIRDLHWHVESSFGAPVSVKSTSSVFSNACNSSGHLKSIHHFESKPVSKSKYFFYKPGW